MKTIPKSLQAIWLMLASMACFSCMTSLVRPFNLSGHPAIAIPLPARSGFPVSLQLVAARGHDELLCAVARHVASRLQ